MIDRNTVLVMAGSRNEFKKWIELRGYDPNDYRYISQRKDLDGVRKGTPIHLAGTHTMNPLWGSELIEADGDKVWVR